MSTKARRRGEIREDILRVAFREFYVHGFQGGNVNRIIDDAKTTKGAFFHHFPKKEELGYAVVDEVIYPLMKSRWLVPIAQSVDVIEELKTLIGSLVEKDIASGNYVLGCPLNNLAQEMSPIDEQFRRKIESVYAQWREALASAIERGMKQKKVLPQVRPESTATLIIAAQMGIWGTARNAKSPTLMRGSALALGMFLESLRTT